VELTLREMLECLERAICYLAKNDDIQWLIPRIERVLNYLSGLPKGDDRDFIEGIRAFFVNYRDMYRQTGIKKKDAAKNWAQIIRHYRLHMSE